MTGLVSDNTSSSYLVSPIFAVYCLRQALTKNYIDAVNMLCAECDAFDLSEAFSSPSAAVQEAKISLPGYRALSEVAHGKTFAQMSLSALAGCELCRLVVDSYPSIPDERIRSLHVPKRDQMMRSICRLRDPPAPPPGESKGNTPPSSRHLAIVAFYPSKVYKEQCWHLIKAFELYIDSGHPSARNGDIEHVAVKAADDPGRIRRWFEGCRLTHETCTSSVKPSGRFSMPTRLLEVDPGTGRGQIRLVMGAHCRGLYAALSHCWGDDLTDKTMKALLGPHSDGIKISSLCKTYQDAITTARNLGLPYLWIDSLCIIQDDKDDWKREAESMADVFANACVTLAASASANGSGGLFYPRAPENEWAIKWTLDESLPPERVKVRARSWRAWEEDVRDAPLNRRGWVLQERLLSPRIIHFGRTQLYWECHGLTESENGAYHHAAFRLEENPFCVTAGKAQSPWDDKDERWKRLVSEYSKCKLTYQSDKLAAIAGVAKTLERLHPDRYIAGLWESELPFNLYWETEKVVADRLPFPTWSWASVGCGVSIPQELSFKRGIESMVSDMEVTIDGSTSECFYSDVQEGRLSLTGYVCSASYDKYQGEVANGLRNTKIILNRSGPDGPMISRVLAMFDGNPIRDQPLSALLLFRKFTRPQAELIHGPDITGFEYYLLLKPLPKAGHFERIGVAQTYWDLDRWTSSETGHRGSWYAQEEPRRLTII